MFIVSLAVADITVAVLVMPLKVAYTLMSQWKFGLPLCKDVAHVRRPVLHGLHPALSAIALDGYWAIHDPINYASERTLKRGARHDCRRLGGQHDHLYPPLIEWNDWPRTSRRRRSACSPRREVTSSKLPKRPAEAQGEGGCETGSHEEKSRHHINHSTEVDAIEISTIAVTDESTSSSANKGSDDKTETNQQDKQMATTEDLQTRNNLTVESARPKGAELWFLMETFT
ncbi:tyramine receptor 1 [Caerostris extrusa]|uniref:Tyramine receptor 1 n=1 Tax=Caerostris extrusa TaxID=172846 RepID=A0AAV4VXE4_CAEEX|nr:tyramine receptor 1 [Caerostris extrusa]